MRRPSARLALLLLLAAALLAPGRATSIVRVDADGTVATPDADAGPVGTAAPSPAAPAAHAAKPPPDRTVVPLLVAVASPDGGRPLNKSAAATAVAAAVGVPRADVTLRSARRSDAGMPCPSRTCAAWTASVAFKGNESGARDLRVDADAGGPTAVATAVALAAAARDPARGNASATVQYTAALYGDDVPPPPGVDDDDDDDDDDSVVPGRGRRLAPGAIVAIVAAAALLVASLAGMAGTVMRGRRCCCLAGAGACLAGSCVGAASADAEAPKTGDASPPANQDAAPPNGTAATLVASPFTDGGAVASTSSTVADAGTRRALADAFSRTATV